MKKERYYLILLFNLFYSFFLIYFHSTTYDTYSGGVCSYWKCIEPNFMILPILMVFSVCFNLLLIILFVMLDEG